MIISIWKLYIDVVSIFKVKDSLLSDRIQMMHLNKSPFWIIQQRIPLALDSSYD